MRNIKIIFKDGTKYELAERGRAGGSYTISIEYKGAFAVVTDEWGNAKSFPATDIKEIETTPDRSW